MPLTFRNISLAAVLCCLLPACAGKKNYSSEKAERDAWEPLFSKVLARIDKSRGLDAGRLLYDSIISKMSDPGPIAKSGRYELQMFYHYWMDHDAAAEDRAVDSALTLFDSPELQAHYPRTYCGFLITKARLAFKMRNFDKANEYIFLAKENVERYLETCDRSGFLYSLAMALYRQKNFDGARKSFQDAFSAQSTCQPQNQPVLLQQQEILGNIGLCHVQLKQYDSALGYFRKELEYAALHRDSILPRLMDQIEGVTKGNMAKVYVAWNRPDSAELLFRRSYEINNRYGYDIRDAQLVALQLADLYGKQKRLPEMKGLLDASRLALDSLKDSEAEKEWRHINYNYYHNTDQQAEEFHAFRSFIELRDSLDAAQNAMEQADISRQLRDHEQQLQIGLLQRDNQVARLYLWVVIVLAVMAAGIIVLMLQNYRRSRRNLAEQTALNEEIGKQKTALERANHEKDRILHVVAHDLRSPIGITAYIADQILLDERDPGLEEQLQMVRAASSQALALTNELLGIQGGGDKVRCELISLVRNVTEMLAYKAKEKNQKVLLNMPEGQLYLFGQEERLKRVLSNLLTNAFKFSPAGKTVEIRIRPQGSFAVLQVKDEGIGIAPQQLEEIFDRFTTAKRKGTAGESSFGLGLSIVRDIILEHGGSITVESSPGQGSCFEVRLPLEQ